VGRRGDSRSGIPVALPIIQSSTFSFDAPEEMIEVFSGQREGYVYSRYDNPTVRHVEERLAVAEGGDFALLFSSGIAAIHAAFWGSLKQGSRLLAARDLYGGTADLMARILPRLGVEIDRADPADPDDFARALERHPSVVYFETPTNPLIHVVDGPRTVALSLAAGARVIVDNTFATPVLQNPLEWGVDIVLHSATKYLGGHSDLILGVAIGRREDSDWMEKCRRSFGAVPDPFAAWLLNRGLMTLPVRVRAQSAAAGSIAASLQKDRRVLRVHYPGLEDDPGHGIASKQMREFGGMLSIELAGGREGATAFMRRLRLFRLATSLGGVESLVSHPVTSSHRMISAEEREALGINDGLVRLSIGLEDTEDLLADIDRALDGEVGRT
jgi:methionine-gamma-lyase